MARSLSATPREFNAKAQSGKERWTGMARRNRFFNVNTDKQANKLPNFTRRMLLGLVGQMMLLAALFEWSNFFPSWLNRVIVASVILVPPLAYLTVLARPAIRQAWRDLLLDSWALIVTAAVAFARLLRPATVMKLGRLVTSLKPMPATVDEWITLCVLPFKTFIVATFPMIWIFEKIVAHTPYFRPYGRVFGLSYDLIFESYLISLLALLFGAILQGIFCRAGRATTTLRFFFLGFVLLFFTMFMPRL
jgi:hypothetical protein